MIFLFYRAQVELDVKMWNKLLFKNKRLNPVFFYFFFFSVSGPIVVEFHAGNSHFL